MLYDAGERAVLSVGSASYDLNPRPVGIPVGRAEQDPSVWVDALFDATAKALSVASITHRCDRTTLGQRVRGIGVSGQQHGLVALDADYQVIRPAKLWCDTESVMEAEELAAKLGWGIVASFTSTKLLWLKRRRPEEFARLEHIALPHDYLNYVLTGNLVMECGDASGTGLLDTMTRQWDERAAAMIDEDLLSKLPPLIGPSEHAGKLLPDVAARMGVAAGIIVSAGGGDNMMSALGCGCAVKGRVAVSLGTSGTIFAKADTAARDVSGAVCPFLDATGGGLPLLCTLNCASVPEEARASFSTLQSTLTAPASAATKSLPSHPRNAKAHAPTQRATTTMEGTLTHEHESLHEPHRLRHSNYVSVTPPASNVVSSRPRSDRRASPASVRTTQPSSSNRNS